MKNKLKNCFLFAFIVITLLKLFWWYISYDDNGFAECIETAGFVTFYDADFGDIRKIELDPISTRVFRNPSGAKYLLQSKNPDQSVSIYNSNGSKLKEILLAGKQIATSNPDHVLIQKVFKENYKPWEMTYDYGLVLSEKEDKVQESTAEHVPAARMIMWGNSKLTVYDKDEKEIYEELFFGRYLNIERAIPCEGSRIVVFTSEYEYPEEFDPDWEYYKTNRRISFSVIDYYQNSNDLQLDINDVNLQTIDDFKLSFEDIQWPIYYGTKLVSVEKFSNIDITSSQDGIHVAGIINNSTVFLVNIETEKIVFIRPLIRSVNGNTKSKVLQIEVSNGSIVRILRHYTKNEDLLVYESYGKVDNITQMHIIK